MARSGFSRLSPPEGAPQPERPMAKRPKKSAPKAPKPDKPGKSNSKLSASAAKHLSEVRVKIDAIDKKLVKLGRFIRAAFVTSYGNRITW